MTDFYEVEVATFPETSHRIAGVKITVPPSVLVIGGEYPEDGAGIVIEVHTACDEDGNDMRLELAHRIVELLSGVASE